MFSSNYRYGELIAPRNRILSKGQKENILSPPRFE